MEKRYKRADNIETLIKSAKLPYNAWKVLFLLDSESTVSDIVSILNEKNDVVEEALERLVAAGLAVHLETESAGEAETHIPEKEEEKEVSGEEEVVAEMPEETEVPADEPETTVEEAVEEQQASETDEEKESSKLTEELEEAVLPEEAPAEDQEEETKEEKEDAVEEETAEAETGTEETADEGMENLEKSLPQDDLDIQIPTEPDLPMEEKETLDVDFELSQPETTEEAPVADKPEELLEKPVASDRDMKTVLVIDDSIVIRKMVEIALEDEEDIQIETSISGKEGLEKMDQLEPHLVILDMMLPDINGVEILKTIKASKGIPVIMLSGKDSPQLIEKAKSEGADEFLPKPFRDEELVDKIKTLLAK